MPTLTLTEAEAEALRRRLEGSDRPVDAPALGAIAGRLGPARREPHEKLGLTRDEWDA